MSEPSPLLRELFFEVFESLPRQGPGSRTATARALALCRELPALPTVLDLGCGGGAQTLHLAELTSGRILALDRHAPLVTQLSRTVVERGLAHRIGPLVGEVARPPAALASFDLVWSEGAFYNVGIESALGVCRRLLRPRGYVAFTDAVWRVEDAPPDVRAVFESEYPDMGRVPGVLAAIERSGFSTAGHFPLPDEAWWDDFYAPMERRIEELRGTYADNEEALAILDELGGEPELHRRHSSSYGYEFFVALAP